MKRISIPLFSIVMILFLLLAACAPIAGMFNTVTISIVYGSEKRAWLEPLVDQYNAGRYQTEDGAVIRVEITPMGSIESVDAILEGRIQPTVWSPASSVYIPVANMKWRQAHGSELVTGTPNDLVLSPVVIAMWESMARALGWPERAIGWADIAALATSEDGWAAYGYPEWGTFKFGHTHPGFSNSGIVSVIAETYAGAGKLRDLTLSDLENPDTQAFVEAVESGIIHYGSSTGFFAERMFERGPSYLSAAVLYENLVVEQESRRLAGESQQLPVVAIYPVEGTFWSNHPYVILNAPWVTEEQRSAAQDFENFLLDRPQQLKALEYGFRPADPSIDLTAPLDAQHGVDPGQPQTILEIPSAEVIAGIENLWEQVKKPVDLVVLIDASGSMQGDKIAAARSSLLQFVDLLSDRDRLQVILFNSELVTLTELSSLGEKRQDIRTRISGIIEGGNTRLYDAVDYAYAELERNADPDHIRAIVVLSDGDDTESDLTLDTLLGRIDIASLEGGSSVKLFTIAFGEDAARDVLVQLAEATGGQQYDSTMENILKVYREIATFF
jgi:Ca-activated chloride channel family protein